MKNVITCLFVLLFAGVSAQDKKQQDIKSIKSMCGCYEIEFNFAETFKVTKDEKYVPSPTKRQYGLEWAELVEDSPNKIVIQHLLIVDTMVIKHWRQDWEYENNEFYQFFKDKTWKFKTLPKTDVKGQWTQRVFQVDDSPRYEGSGTWIHADGRNFWTDKTDAPLPRREHTIRNDYNVLNRTNTHEITSFGWIHDQDNAKIVRDDSGTDKILTYEKGYDIYTKVPDSRCKAATDFWAKNKNFWKNVRDKWETVYARDKDLNLQAKVDGKQLYEYLFDLNPNTSKDVSDQIVDSFIK
jgi:hypothetical protein